jgi:hypothetical protein
MQEGCWETRDTGRSKEYSFIHPISHSITSTSSHPIFGLTESISPFGLYFVTLVVDLFSFLILWKSPNIMYKTYCFYWMCVYLYVFLFYPLLWRTFWTLNIPFHLLVSIPMFLITHISNATVLSKFSWICFLVCFISICVVHYHISW